MVVDRLILAASLGLGLIVAGSALAQDTAKPAAVPPSADRSQPAGKPDFATLEKNHRGYLLRSDVPHSMKHLRLHYDEADYNHDGRLSEAEYVGYSGGPYQEDLTNSQLRSQEGTLGRRQSERLNLGPSNNRNSSGH
jgi:hypothetical protein